MKAKVSLLALLVLGSSILAINISNADEGIYGVVNNGIVTNAIICSDPNCGGALGGERIVLQVSPSQTSGTGMHGQGGWFNDPARGISVTESNGIFTKNDNGKVESWTSPQKGSDGSYSWINVSGYCTDPGSSPECAQATFTRDGGSAAIVEKTTFGSRLSLNDAYSHIQNQGLVNLANNVNVVLYLLNNIGWIK